MRATSASAGGSRFVRWSYRMFCSIMMEPSEEPFGSAIGEGFLRASSFGDGEEEERRRAARCGLRVVARGRRG